MIKKVKLVVEWNLLEELKKVIPQVFEEGKINFKKFQEILTKDKIMEENERFHFNWAGKSEVFKLIQAPAYGTLCPVKEKSIDFDHTHNLVIIGENLEVLKLLLKSYFEKVKMIYIDPPYNTGKDFIYRDNFKEPLLDYLKKTGQISQEGITLTTNLERSGRFHSDWLNFIYPRLVLARNLLREDGVIFVSIDDNEVHHLRMIMDEIFGEENFIAEICWHSKYTISNDAKYLSTQHEYILFYAKQKTKIELNLLPRTEKMNQAYRNPDNDPRGPWKATPLHAKSGKGESYSYTFKNGVIWKAPKGRYPRYSIETLRKLEEEGRITFGKDGKGTPSVKTYLAEVQQGKKSGTVWGYEEVGHTHKANEELASILGKGIFDNPKPTGLIKKMIQLTTSKYKDLILDFFAGSGTTGHAVWEANFKDLGSRQFILVNLDEKVNKTNVQEAYHTITDICIERLQRVSKFLKIKAENGGIESQDFGFKVFRITKSNFNSYNTFNPPNTNDVEGIKAHYLEWLKKSVKEPLKEGWNEIDVIYEIILKEGFDLNAKISNFSLGANKFYEVIDLTKKSKFIISLDPQIFKETGNLLKTQKFIGRLAYFFDSALTDELKLNLAKHLILKVI
ncbi:MAG: site-specific DNA-methyltransferase [Candidatus Helarchaeota archaeon]